MANEVSIHLYQLKYDQQLLHSLNAIKTYSKQKLKMLNKTIDIDTIEDITQQSLMYWIKCKTYDSNLTKPITYYTTILTNNYYQSFNTLIKYKQLFDSLDTVDNVDHLRGIANDEIEFDDLDTKSFEQHIKDNYPILYKYTYQQISYKDLAKQTGFSLQYIKNKIRLNKKQLWDFYNVKNNKANKNNPFLNNK